jgi:hypothetical protein
MTIYHNTEHTSEKCVLADACAHRMCVCKSDVQGRLAKQVSCVCRSDVQSICAMQSSSGVQVICVCRSMYLDVGAKTDELVARYR